MHMLMQIQGQPLDSNRPTTNFLTLQRPSTYFNHPQQSSSTSLNAALIAPSGVLKQPGKNRPSAVNNEPPKRINLKKELEEHFGMQEKGNFFLKQFLTNIKQRTEKYLQNFNNKIKQEEANQIEGVKGFKVKTPSEVQSPITKRRSTVFVNTPKGSNLTVRPPTANPDVASSTET